MSEAFEHIQLDNTLTATEKQAIESLQQVECTAELVLQLRDNTVTIVDGGEEKQMTFEQITTEINNWYVQASAGHWMIKVDTAKGEAPQWIKDIVDNPRDNDFAYFLQVCANTLGTKIAKEYGPTDDELVDVQIDAIFGNQTRQISEQFEAGGLDDLLREYDLTFEYDESFGYIVGKDETGTVRFKQVPNGTNIEQLNGVNPCLDILETPLISEALNTIHFMVDAGIAAGIMETSDKTYINELIVCGAQQTSTATELLDFLAHDSVLNQLFQQAGLSGSLEDFTLDKIQTQVAHYYYTEHHKETRSMIREFIAHEKLDERTQIYPADMHQLAQDFDNGTKIVITKYPWVTKDMVKHYQDEYKKIASRFDEHALRATIKDVVIAESNGVLTPNSSELADKIDEIYAVQETLFENKLKRNLLSRTLMTGYMEEYMTNDGLFNNMFSGDWDSLQGVYANSEGVGYWNLSDENVERSKKLAREVVIMAIATVATMGVGAALGAAASGLVWGANAVGRTAKVLAVGRTLLKAGSLGTTFYTVDNGLRNTFDGTSFFDNWQASEAAKTSAMFVAFGMMKHLKGISRTVTVGNKTVANPFRILDLNTPKSSWGKVAKEIFVGGNMVFALDSGVEAVFDGTSLGEAFTREEYVQAMLMMGAMKGIELGSRKMIKVFRESGKVKVTVQESYKKGDVLSYRQPSTNNRVEATVLDVIKKKGSPDMIKLQWPGQTGNSAMVLSENIVNKRGGLIKNPTYYSDVMAWMGDVSARSPQALSQLATAAKITTGTIIVGGVAYFLSSDGNGTTKVTTQSLASAM